MGILYSMKKSIRIPKKLMGKKLEGEWVFLNLENGEYYGLNETGSLVWDSLVKNKNLEAILESLKKKFQVEESRLEREVKEFLVDLQKEGLIEVRDN